jgi:hypothetical protein
MDRTFTDEMFDALKIKREEVDRCLEMVNDAQATTALLEVETLLRPILDMAGTTHYIYFGYQRMCVHVYCEPLSFKVGPVAQVLEAVLASEHYTDIKSEDLTSSGVRQFSFEGPKIKVEITATPKETEDAACRKVQVGVQEITVPVYEVRCD